MRYVRYVTVIQADLCARTMFRDIQTESHICCIFRPAFGCCAPLRLVEIFLFSIFCAKKLKKFKKVTCWQKMCTPYVLHPVIVCFQMNYGLLLYFYDSQGYYGQREKKGEKYEGDYLLEVFLIDLKRNLLSNSWVPRHLIKNRH